MDLVFSPSNVSSPVATREDPTYASFLGRLAPVRRLILFDKRRTELSDPALDVSHDAGAERGPRRVLDAARSGRAVLFGVCGGALCIQLVADLSAKPRLKKFAPSSDMLTTGTGRSAAGTRRPGAECPGSAGYHARPRR